MKIDFKELVSVFDVNLCLGSEYSLLDLDFADTTKQHIDSVLAKVEYENNKSYFNAWPDVDIRELELKLSGLSRVESTTSWNEVNSRYLRDHTSGLVYLSSKGMLFYIAAWINCYLKGEKDDLNFFHEEILSLLSTRISSKTRDGVLITTVLSDKQKSYISNFLRYLRDLDDEDSFLAEECLDKGWNRF